MTNHLRGFASEAPDFPTQSGPLVLRTVRPTTSIGPKHSYTTSTVTPVPPRTIMPQTRLDSRKSGCPFRRLRDMRILGVMTSLRCPKVRCDGCRQELRTAVVSSGGCPDSRISCRAGLRKYPEHPTGVGWPAGSRRLRITTLAELVRSLKRSSACSRGRFHTLDRAGAHRHTSADRPRVRPHRLFLHRHVKACAKSARSGIRSGGPLGGVGWIDWTPCASWHVRCPA